MLRHLIGCALILCALAPLGAAPEARTCSCYRLAQEPLLDGKPDDAAWQSLPEASGFLTLKREGYPVRKPTTFRIGWGKDALFVGVRCREPFIPRLKALTSDGDILRDDDSIEIFLAPAGMDYLQLIANSVGTRWNGENGEAAPKLWAWQAKAGVAGEAWTLELRIPFTVLGRTPKEGHAWRCNVATGPDDERCSCWAPVKRGFGDVAGFATLAFKGTPVAAEVAAAQAQMGAAYQAFLKAKPARPANAAANAKRSVRLDGNGSPDLFVNASQSLKLEPGTACVLRCDIKRSRFASGSVSVDVIEAKPGQPLSAAVREGLSVGGVEARAQGPNPGVKVHVAGHPETDGRRRAAAQADAARTTREYDDAKWPAAASDAQGYAWAAAKAAPQAFLRQVILWNQGHDGPDRCINPIVREWGISEDSMETLFLSLYSHFPYPLDDYEFLLDVPGGMRLLDIMHEDGRNLLNLKPSKVSAEEVTHDGRPFTRYRIAHPRNHVRPVQIGGLLLAVHLEKWAAKERTTAWYYRRVAKGNFTELEQRIPVRVLPPINGRMLKKIQLSQYCAVPRGYTRLSPEHPEQHLRQSFQAGFNTWVFSQYNAGTHPYHKAIHDRVLKAGGKIILWKSQMLRVVAAFGLGVDLQSSPEASGGMLSWVGEATRILATYEDLLLEGERDDSPASCDKLVYPQVLVLKRGSERLVLLFSEGNRPLEVTLRNKGLKPGRTATIFGSNRKVPNPAEMKTTVPDGDVAVVRIL